MCDIMLCSFGDNFQVPNSDASIVAAICSKQNAHSQCPSNEHKVTPTERLLELFGKTAVTVEPVIVTAELIIQLFESTYCSLGIQRFQRHHSDGTRSRVRFRLRLRAACQRRDCGCHSRGLAAGSGAGCTGGGWEVTAGGSGRAGPTRSKLRTVLREPLTARCVGASNV